MEKTLLYDGSALALEITRISLSPGEELPLSFPSGLGFIFTEEGEVDVFFSDNRATVKKDEGLFVNKGRAARLRSYQGCTFVSLTFVYHAFTQGGFVETRYLDVLASSSLDYVVLSRQGSFGLVRVLDSIEAGRCGFELSAASGLFDVLSLICYEKESLFVKERVRDERLERMLSFMKASLETRLSLADIAAAGFVSQREAARLFEKYLSSSPMKYFLSLRLEEAKRLLEDRSLSIGQVSQLTGFESISHFSTCFRKRYAASPSEYRMRN